MVAKLSEMSYGNSASTHTMIRLQAGDMLGDIRVENLLRILPNSAIYRVTRLGETYFLKVAHNDDLSRKYLIDEAQTFQEINSNSAMRHRAIPTLQPHGAVYGADPYGRVQFRDVDLIYILLEYKAGDFLGDVLLDNPQPYHKHVGYFMLDLCHVISLINRKLGRLHLNIVPNSLFTYRMKVGDAEKIILPYLLDLGLLIRIEDVEDYKVSFKNNQLRERISLPYRAPEFIKLEVLGEYTEVYSLGLLMYEMLEGQLSFSNDFLSEDEMHKRIKFINLKLKRTDLPEIKNSKGENISVKGITEKALSRQPSQRYKTVADLDLALRDVYPKIPEEKREWTMQTLLARGGAFIALGVVVLLVLFTGVMVLLATLNPPILGG